VWTSVVAIVPALLGSILIFMDQQITAVIVNRKEHKLLKGCGYHLDLLIVSCLIVVCSVLGIPWFVAATVLSINHVRSLQRESESAAPGEKPSFLGIREQRVTHVLIFLTIGLSVFTKKELQVLDDILPAFKRHDRMEDEEALQQNDDNLERRESANLRYTQSAVEVDMANGKVMRIPHASIKNKQQINITEEMNKSGVWKSLESKPAESVEGERSPVSKDNTPDEGIVIKIDKDNLREVGDEEEKKSLVSSSESKND